MDHTTYLQSLLDEGGLITLSHGFYEITRPLEICNNTHLLCSPNVTIRLADNANCPMLVNRCRGQEKPSRRIIIEGGVWDGNNIGQDRDKYIHPLAKVGQAFSFACTEDLCIKGLTIKDPNSYGIMLTDTRRFTVRDIRFDCNCLTLNQDGIHVNGYAYDGYITNITGNTNDDMIALNTDESDFFSPCNDTENIVIDGVYGGDNGWTAVRLLSRNAHMKQIVIRNIFGAYKFNAVSFTHWDSPDEDYGHFDNVIIENVFATSCRTSGTGHGGLIWFQDGVHHVGTVIIRNFIRNEREGLNNETAQITIGKDVSIDTLILEHVKQKVFNRQPQLDISPQAKIGSFFIDGIEKR